MNAIRKAKIWESALCLYKSWKSVDCLIQGNCIMLPEDCVFGLPRNRLGSEDVLLEEALLDEFSRYLRKAQQWMV